MRDDRQIPVVHHLADEGVPARQQLAAGKLQQDAARAAQTERVQLPRAGLQKRPIVELTAQVQPQAGLMRDASGDAQAMAVSLLILGAIDVRRGDDEGDSRIRRTHGHLARHLHVFRAVVHARQDMHVHVNHRSSSVIPRRPAAPGGCSGRGYAGARSCADRRSGSSGCSSSSSPCGSRS